MKRNILRCLVALGFVAGLTACGASSNDAEDVAEDTVSPACSVYFLDVGQGDSELILTDTAAVLIDAGEIGEGDIVLADLKEAGVETLDWIIMTHPHSDHIGGVPDILNYAAKYDDLTVENVMITTLPDDMIPTTNVYERMLDSVENAGVSLTEAVKMTIDLGSATLEIVPSPGNDYSSLNDYSICAYLTCGESTFLFTGDTSNPEERDLLEAGAVRHADVLKVGHHGSRTSSGEDFLSVVTPKIAVISCGVKNSYGHPTDEALNRLSEYCGEYIYRTDEDGTICVTTDGTEISVVTHALGA